MNLTNSTRINQALSLTHSANSKTLGASPKKITIHPTKQKKIITPVNLNDIPESHTAEIVRENKRDLEEIKKHAAYLVTTEKDQQNQFFLLRLFVQDSNAPLRDKEIQSYLIEARSNLVGAAKPTRKGERMDTSPTPWVWEGVIMAGTTNLLVAPPKVGKSALMIGMIGAWWRGEESYLGHRLHGNCPKVFIVGTDQPSNDWYTILKREKLIDGDGELGGPIECLWHTGAPLHLNEKGIAELEVIASENPGAFFLLDSYHACVSPLGIDESTSAFDGPARALASALAAYGCTLTMIHHTNKSVAGGNATNASRGSNALPAAASLTILLNWLKQPPEGQTQTDYRVILKTQGRAKSTTAVFELLDEGWITHGDGSEAMAQEARAEAELDLQGRQADIFDYIKDRFENGGFEVSSTDLMTQFRLERTKANRALAQLTRKGLIYKSGEVEVTLDGGRPAALFRPLTPLPAEGVFNVSNVFNPPEHDGVDSPTSHAVRGLTHKTRLIRLYEGGGSKTHPPNRLNTPLINSPVERFLNNEWEGGWLIHDAKELNNITIVKAGNPLLTVSKLRWDIDLRPCSSPFAIATHDRDQENENVASNEEPDLSLIDSPLPPSTEMD